MIIRNSFYKVIPHKVSIGDQDRLDNDFSKEELFSTLCSMQNGKSPSMNGFPCEFYKVMWDIVGYDFAAWHINPSPREIKKALIKLIPKYS